METSEYVRSYLSLRPGVLMLGTPFVADLFTDRCIDLVTLYRNACGPLDFACSRVDRFAALDATFLVRIELGAGPNGEPVVTFAHESEVAFLNVPAANRLQLGVRPLRVMRLRN